MNLHFRVGLPVQLVLFFRRMLNRIPDGIPASSPATRRRIGVAFGALQVSSDGPSSSSASMPPPPTQMRKAKPASPTPPVPPPPRPEREPEPEQPPQPPSLERGPYDWPIHEIMRSPVLFDPIRPPRHPIVLCHGLYGFDVRGPASFPRLQMHYWSSVLQILRERVGAQVFVAAVPSTGSVHSRAEALDKFLSTHAKGMDLNFMAHSMGGLDCRHLISNVRVSEREYNPRSLTCISTPHQGSPFMDWCLANIGIGASRIPHKPFARPQGLPYSLKSPLFEPRPQRASTAGPQPRPPPESSSASAASEAASSLLSVATLAGIPSSFTALLLSLIDSPAYSNLTTSFLQSEFNANTPDLPSVRYFSLAGRISSMSILHPLWLPKLILDAVCPRAEGGNDGLVSVKSARWGEFLGVLEECDHWDLRGARGLGASMEGFLDVFKPSASSSSPPIDDYLPTSFPEEVEEESEVFADKSTATPTTSHAEVREALESAVDAAADKRATDRLSTVLDWLTEHVPLGAPSSSSSSTTKKPSWDKSQWDVADKERKSDLSSRADLEKVYVALCRKLYDEGL